MSRRTNDTTALPASHIFLTAACGRRQRTVVVPRWGAMAIAAVLAAVVLWSLGCTVYVIGHDSLVAAAMRRERDLQYGFEDRILTLQRELERTTTAHAQLERSVGSRLDTLAGQEADLRRRAEKVAALAQDVLHFATRTAPMSHQAASGPAGEATPATDTPAAVAPVASGRQAAVKASALSADFAAMAANQDRQVADLQAAVAGRVAGYRDALAQAGLSMARYSHETSASGGPFVPLDPKTVASPFDRASLTLEGTLAAATELRDAVAHTPFDKPLAGDPEITSPFGARTDPFLGRPALHTGIDLREDTGTAVLATAPGRVAFAGSASGYGTMVEVDHGAGLTTRYAHLSAVTVDVGQTVEAGSVVGRVGATGRATGPHLHYETRIDGEPVDPMRFLQAGHRLADAAAP